MPLKFYKLILKIGVFASFISFFIIANNYYFPFITGKQIYFNVLIEVLFIFWVGMIVKYPQTRPRPKNWINIALVSFFVILLISSIQGIDFNLSFWGDAERMLGWFHIVHFFCLYLIISTVFVDKKDWYWLLGCSVLSAVGIAGYAFMTNQGQKAVGNVNMTSNISTLGNATYVAGLMLANIWFSIILFHKSRNWLLKGLIAFVALLITWSFFYADVSGSQAGLAVGLLTMLSLFSFLNKNKRFKQVATITLISMVAILALMFAFRSNAIFDNNKVGKILRDFSLKNTTLNTRFYAWRAAVLGIKEMPLLGSGYGNYAYFFDKYFLGSYYQWTMSEEYFDRAHNNLLDIAATGGILSLIAYLGVFAAAICYLTKNYRRGKISLFDYSVLMAAFTSYFVHNLAVFDSLANYVIFMIMLAMVYSYKDKTVIAPQVVEAEPYLAVKIKHKENKKDKIDENWDFTNKELIALIAAGLFSGFLMFNYNSQFAQMFSDSIEASRSWQNGDLGTVNEAWQKALSHNTPLDRDVRSLLGNQIASNYTSMMNLKGEDRDSLLKLAAEAQENNIRYNPRDSMANLWAAQVYFYKGILENNVKDVEIAYKYVKDTVNNGGQHIPPMVLKSNIELVLGETDEAIKTLRTATDWYPEYYDLYCHLTDYQLRVKKSYISEAYDDFKKCLNSSKATGLNEAILKIAELKYEKEKNWEVLVKINEIKYVIEPTNKALKQHLIDLYKKAGQLENAKNLETSK